MKREPTYFSAKTVPGSVKDSILTMFKHARLEDQEEREAAMREYKRHEDFFNGFQYKFWNEATMDWEFPPEEELEDLPKIVNVFRGHEESVTAALSSALPFTRFYPDDADSIQDVDTAKSYTKGGELIQKQNKAKLIFIKAIHTLINEGIVAFYNYREEDEKYGVAKIPKYKPVMVEKTQLLCTNCGADVTPEEDEQNPMASFGQIDNLACPQCGSIDEPQKIVTEEQESRLIRFDDVPKSRECIDVFGGRYVKIPRRARKQADVPYLLLAMEHHHATVNEAMQDILDFDVNPTEGDYERDLRIGYTYSTNTLVTCYYSWFRPSYYTILGKSNQERIDELRKYFPNGCCATILGEEAIFAEVEESPLDEHWTILPQGTSEYLHSAPVARSLVPLQEMKNNLTNLTLDTIEFGIPITFFTPEVLNPTAYREREARPGDMVPTNEVIGGRSISEQFHTPVTAQLSREVEPFGAKLEQDTQFVFGSFPSIYGGSSGGATLGEYQQSRNQALQRLSLLWASLNLAWADVIKKSCDEWFSAMLEDERFVMFENDTFINFWIRRSNLNGRIGRIEAETAETFPITFAQKQDILMKLLTLNSDQINAVLYSPQNAQLLHEGIGLEELKVPGIEQRIKQQREIVELMKDQPMEDPLTGQLTSSVQIEPEIDDDEIHMDTLKGFLVEYGVDLRRENPAAYMNCVAHFQAHKQNFEMAQMQMMMQQAAMNPAPEETGTEEEVPPPQPKGSVKTESKTQTKTKSGGIKSKTEKKEVPVNG